MRRRRGRWPSRPPAVSVLARTYVSFRVEREAAQRARRPAGVDDVEGSLGEGSRLRAGEPDPQHRGPVLLVLKELFLGLGEILLGVRVELHEGLRLDDHA